MNCQRAPALDPLCDGTSDILVGTTDILVGSWVREEDEKGNASRCTLFEELLTLSWEAGDFDSFGLLRLLIEKEQVRKQKNHHHTLGSRAPVRADIQESHSLYWTFAIISAMLFSHHSLTVQCRISAGCRGCRGGAAIVLMLLLASISTLFRRGVVSNDKSLAAMYDHVPLRHVCN